MRFILSSPNYANAQLCTCCREHSDDVGALARYKPRLFGRWISLCHGCQRTYPMTKLGRWYSSVVRWWKHRHERRRAALTTG